MSFTRLVPKLFLLSVFIFHATMPFRADAQLYPVRIYTETDGLASSTVYGIVQDFKGILWIARRSGISSYDGSAFRNYNISDGLKPASCFFLRLDEHGKLWSFPEKGYPFIANYEMDRWITLTVDPHGDYPGPSTYTSFEVYYKGDTPKFLVGTDYSGIMIFNKGQWLRYSQKDGLSSDKVSAVNFFNGEIYIATDKGLCVLSEDGKIRDVSSRLDLPSDYIIAMTVEGEKMWILGESWLGYLQDGKFSLVISGFSIKDSRLGYHGFIYTHENDQVVFGNASCVFFYSLSGGKLESLGRHNGLISEGATSALIDRENNLWITGYRGIIKISSRRFTSYFEHDGLASNEVASGLETSTGHFVFGHEGALSFFDGKSFSHQFFKIGKGFQGYNSRVLDIKKDKGNNLWIAANVLGLGLLKPDQQIVWFHEAQGLKGTVYSVDILDDGTVYAGSTKGLYRFLHGRFEPVQLPGIENVAIRKVFHDISGNLFFATLTNGLTEWVKPRVLNFQCRDNKLANNVFSLFIDSHKRNWVGTAAGLYTISGDSLVRFNDHSLAISRPVYLILEDKYGRLWFGTDNGLYRWDGNATQHYTVADGLSGQELNRGAGFQDSSGNIWFGTNNGLTVFRPEYDYNISQMPGPDLSFQYMVAGKDTFNLKKDVELPYDLNDFQFHFRAISFINEKQIMFRYKMEGIDTSWSGEFNLPDNQFDFFNLGPGRYRFWIKARNAIGIWSEAVCSPMITIHRPFWSQWWFLATILLLIAGFAYLLIRFILSTRYRKKLVEMVEIRTRELEKSESMLRESNKAKDNFFSIIAHDLRSPFNVMLGMLDLLITEYDDYSDTERQMILNRLKNASLRTIDLLDNLLTWARGQRELLPFSPGNINIHELLKHNISLVEPAAQSKDILIKLNGQDNICAYADRNMMNTVVRNLISNAIKFSFPGGLITVDLSLQENRTVLVSVKDNGFGMNPEILGNLFKIEYRMVTKGTNNETGTGLGLILCKDFITRNNGEIRVESEEGAGSTFYFTLPAGFMEPTFRDSSVPQSA